MSAYQWISWEQATPDHRPLTFPPNQDVMGWWCSGYTSDEAATLCAMVRADSEDEARAVVRRDWPEADNWRFCEPKDSPHPGGNRFVPTDWMLERINAAKVSP